MKKLFLLSAFALFTLTVACGDPATTPSDDAENPAFVLSKIKDATSAVPKDWVEVTYASTNPAVVSELTVFFWENDGTLGPRGKAPKTKASRITEKMVITNIKINGNKMTADEMLVDTEDNSEQLVGVYEMSLNEMGYATNIKFTSKNTDSENNEMTVEYNADGYMTKVSYVSEKEKDVYEFTYTDGNISKKTETYSYNNGTEDKEFKYETIISGYQTENKGGIITPVLMDTGVMFEVFCSLGVLGKPAPSLPSKAVWSEDEYETYSYEKYASGYLSAMTMNYTSVEEGKTFSDVTKYSFEYIEVPVI